MTHDIFLSYRRDGGFETAKYLFDRLTKDRYVVSFDIDTLRNGRFDEALLSRIDECTDFVIILSKGCFDRTLDPEFPVENDWMRQELAYALAKGKNVIPVLLPGFSEFPHDLPEDVRAVVGIKGPVYSREYLKAFYSRLTMQFLQSEPIGVLDKVLGVGEDSVLSDGTVQDGLRENRETILRHSRSVLDFIVAHKISSAIFVPAAIALAIWSLPDLRVVVAVEVPVVALWSLSIRKRKTALIAVLVAMSVATALWLLLADQDLGLIMAIGTDCCIAIVGLFCGSGITRKPKNE